LFGSIGAQFSVAERMIDLFGELGHCLRYHFDAEWLCKRVFGHRSIGHKNGRVVC
jgi:hypothetical protein